jgi:transposase
MRGEHREDGGLFSYVALEDRIPKKHPIRKARRLVDAALEDLDGVFDEIYSESGRPSIPPEQLIRASMLQVLYSIRSERQLIEQLDYNLMFRWFVGLSIDTPIWHPTTFTKNRDRLAQADAGRRIFEALLFRARKKGLVSSKHFSVDGTLIQGWASQKSVRRKDDSDDDDPDGVGRNSSRNFHGEKRSNKTHASRTDAEALIARKGNAVPAAPSYAGHILIENRNGLLVDAELTQATGTAERDAALEMSAGLPAGATLGADKGYDTRGFVQELRAQRLTPHVAQNTNRRGGSAVDGRTTRHDGYGVSQRCRKRVEEPFGWAKTVGGIRQVKLRGLKRVRQLFLFVMATYNLVRLRNLMPDPA